MTRGTRSALLVIALGAIVLWAYYEWRSGRPVEPLPPPAPTAAPAPPVNAGASPAAPVQESSATFEIPVESAGAPAAEEPAVVPAMAPTEVRPVEPVFVEERPPDSASRCLTLEASPSSMAAYGAMGAAVQLVVRVRNGCSTAFSGPSTYFRAIATSYEGFDLGSAVGRFSGQIGPFGTAETLIAIEVDPTRVRNWRAELR